MRSQPHERDARLPHHKTPSAPAVRARPASRRSRLRPEGDALLAGLISVRRAAAFAIVASTAGLTIAPASGDAALDREVAALERTVIEHPEDLRSCADYRQRIITSGEYDRSIKLLERLTARSGSGPNVHISLALAYVDKVPVVSPFRRIFLGQDAMRALSRAIEREPSLVAYYIRGLIALYYPEGVFHRARGGIADLERARALLAGQPVRPSYARVYVSLGDGYWKVHDLARAESIWNDGLNRFPGDPALRARLANRGSDLDRVVEHALDPATRMDTSLQEIFAPLPAH
jgi:hypothetical protein